MTSKRALLALTMAAGVWLAACSDGGNDVAPITVDATQTAPPAAPSTTQAVTTTEAVTTTTEAEATTTTMATMPSTSAPAVAGGPVFSDALGVKVDTAPGVNTPGDTRQLLPEGLYIHIAWEPDPNDPSVFTVQPGDEPILEAYANAAREFYFAATGSLTIEPARFRPYMIDAGAQFAASLENARSQGYVDSLGSGVTLRPYVLADNRTADTAIVLDCTLSDEQFVRSVDEVERGVQVTRGQLATMTRIESTWKVDVFSEEAAACL